MFRKPVQRGETVRFDCDYHRLVRWLMKTSFNSVRIHEDNASVAVWRPHRQYMLTGRPEPRRLKVYLQLVTATVYRSDELCRMTEDQVATIPRTADGGYELLPPICDVSSSVPRDPRLQGVLFRVVAIQSFPKES